jgi:hypothetical protein
VGARTPRRLVVLASIGLALAAGAGAPRAESGAPDGEGAQTITLYVPPLAAVSVGPDGAVTGASGTTGLSVVRTSRDGVETVTVIPEPR